MGRTKVRFKYSLAVAAAIAAHAALPQQGGPPGSEDLGYGEDEDEANVEVVIAIGDRYRCPDGTIVNDVVNCPEFIVFSINYSVVTYNPRSHIVPPPPESSAPICGDTVDNGCDCGTGKVKVYDEGGQPVALQGQATGRGVPRMGSDVRLRPECLEVR